jgi:hypothetical protein
MAVDMTAVATDSGVSALWPIQDRFEGGARTRSRAGVAGHSTDDLSGTSSENIRDDSALEILAGGWRLICLIWRLICLI